MYINMDALDYYRAKYQLTESKHVKAVDASTSVKLDLSSREGTGQKRQPTSQKSFLKALLDQDPDVANYVQSQLAKNSDSKIRQR